MSIPYAAWERDLVLANRFQPRARQFFATTMPHRTFASIKDYANRTGIPLQSFRRFASEEDAILRRYYPDYAKVMKFLPHRSIDSLKDRAKYLGITARKKRWTEAADEALTKLATIHTDAQIGAILGRSPKSVQLRRGLMDIRPRNDPRRAHPAIFADIEGEAAKRGVRLGTLCAGLKAPKLRADKRGQMTAIHAVVKAFGGELYAEWDD